MENYESPTSRTARGLSGPRLGVSMMARELWSSRRAEDLKRRSEKRSSSENAMHALRMDAASITIHRDGARARFREPDVARGPEDREESLTETLRSYTGELDGDSKVIPVGKWAESLERRVFYDIVSPMRPESVKSSVDEFFGEEMDEEELVGSLGDVEEREESVVLEERESRMMRELRNWSRVIRGRLSDSQGLWGVAGSGLMARGRVGWTREPLDLNEDRGSLLRWVLPAMDRSLLERGDEMPLALDVGLNELEESHVWIRRWCAGGQALGWGAALGKVPEKKVHGFVSREEEEEGAISSNKVADGGFRSPDGGRRSGVDVLRVHGESDTRVRRGLLRAYFRSKNRSMASLTGDLPPSFTTTKKYTTSSSKPQTNWRQWPNPGGVLDIRVPALLETEPPRSTPANLSRTHTPDHENNDEQWELENERWRQRLDRVAREREQRASELQQMMLEDERARQLRDLERQRQEQELQEQERQEKERQEQRRRLSERAQSDVKARIARLRQQEEERRKQMEDLLPKPQENDQEEVLLFDPDANAPRLDRPSTSSSSTTSTNSSVPTPPASFFHQPPNFQLVSPQGSEGPTSALVAHDRSVTPSWGGTRFGSSELLVLPGLGEDQDQYDHTTSKRRKSSLKVKGGRMMDGGFLGGDGGFLGGDGDDQVAGHSQNEQPPTKKIQPPITDDVNDVLFHRDLSDPLAREDYHRQQRELLLKRQVPRQVPRPPASSSSPEKKRPSSARPLLRHRHHPPIAPARHRPLTARRRPETSSNYKILPRPKTSSTSPPPLRKILLRHDQSSRATSPISSPRAPRPVPSFPTSPPSSSSQKNPSSSFSIDRPSSRKTDRPPLRLPTPKTRPSTSPASFSHLRPPSAKPPIRRPLTARTVRPTDNTALLAAKFAAQTTKSIRNQYLSTSSSSSLTETQSIDESALRSRLLLDSVHSLPYPDDIDPTVAAILHLNVEIL